MFISPHPPSMPANNESAMAEAVDEPPEERFLRGPSIPVEDGLVYVKPLSVNQKESLLTRALKTSPELFPSDRRPSDDNAFYHPYPYHSMSGVSTAELTSDGGLSSPSLSNASSPSLPPIFVKKQYDKEGIKHSVADASESTVEANLGRKRCISFACGRRVEPYKTRELAQQSNRPATEDAAPESVSTEPAKRKSALTFVCPGRDSDTKEDRSLTSTRSLRVRPRGSPAPIFRRPTNEPRAAPSISIVKDQKSGKQAEYRGIPTSGLGKFEDSEATRFHEFASSMDDDDEWVKKAVDYAGRITLSDCMSKENAIRRLGEEAEEEAMNEEDDGEIYEDDEDDDEDDDDGEYAADDGSTIYDLSDDGNESDNEAGFASDDSDASDTEFWATPTTARCEAIDTKSVATNRRYSNASYGSCNDRPRRRIPGWSRKGRSQKRSVAEEIRPSTADLPDSTDFVCGTLDEDRPLETAYKFRMERLRMSRQIPIPQDIDPSFPTTDPESDGDDDGVRINLEGTIATASDNSTRGRTEELVQNSLPHHSPKRFVSPPPRRSAMSPPKRLRSPPPRVKVKANSDSAELAETDAANLSPDCLGFNGLAQQWSPIPRTKSLPRTPSPFFISLKEHNRLMASSPLEDIGEVLEMRSMRTRGPIDIVEGLEKRRQRRKEKYWRQHCRKAAKEQMEWRPAPGRGAERMKELGLEVAERCRAYGVEQDVQLMLSV